METVSEGKTAAKVISHYAGSGEALTWTSEGIEKWSRNIPGIDGALDAVETSGGSTTLELHDLQGNIVGTVGDSESETKLLWSYNSTEFGVPQPGTTPPKYAWLGAGGVATEPSFSSGVSTQGGASYVPEIGRPLQTEPIASPGSFPDGTAGVGIVQAAYLQAAAGEIKGIAIEQEAAFEAARRKEAYEAEGQCEKYPDSSACHVDGPGEGNCEANCVRYISSAGVEESACEYAAETGQVGEGCGGGGGYECSGDKACAAAPCADGDNPHSNHCGTQLPGSNLCPDPARQGCRVTGKVPKGARLGELQILSSPEGPLAGCIVGGVVGGTFALASSAGLATQAGAYGGCFVGGGVVIIVEHIL
jgi:hypothetical protein